MQGLRIAVIEREPDTLPLPRAVHFDSEVMRIFGTANSSPDTYQTKREAHVREPIEAAVRRGGIIQITASQVAAERDRRVLATGKDEIVNLSPRLGPGMHTGNPPVGGDLSAAAARRRPPARHLCPARS